MKITPEKIQTLLKDMPIIDAINQPVAEGRMTMSQFDEYMTGQLQSWMFKRLVQGIALVAIVMHINSEYRQSKDLSELFPMLLCLATAFGILYGGSRIIEPYLSGTNLFFLNKTQRSLNSFNSMRASRLNVSRGEVVRTALEARLGNCYEKSCVAFEHLKQKKELLGFRITQFALVSPENEKHDHTLLVISQDQFDIENAKEKVFSDWAKEKAQAHSIIVVDPWRGTVCYGKDTDESYSIEKQDFSEEVAKTSSSRAPGRRS